MIPNSLPQNPLLLAPARPLPKSVGVIGAGTIGPDIGYYLASEIPGLRLVLLDIDPAALERSRARLRGYSDKLVKRGKLSADAAADLDARLVTTLDYAALAECDWVLEAATEDLRIKRKIFAQIEAVVRPDAVITSNTSSLPAERLYAELQRPERATVTHFFAPAHRNPVVEVVTWDRADGAVVQWLRWLFARTGKVPLVTRDAVCFMLDRIFDNWCNEAAYLLGHASAAEIDAVASEFVHAGPFFVLNLANGNPIIIETNSLQAEEEGAHYAPAPILSSVDRWKTIAPGQKAPDVRRNFARASATACSGSSSRSPSTSSIATSAHRKTSNSARGSRSASRPVRSRSWPRPARRKSTASLRVSRRSVPACRVGSARSRTTCACVAACSSTASTASSSSRSGVRRRSTRCTTNSPTRSSKCSASTSATRRRSVS